MRKVFGILSNGVWYLPSSGANGVVYTVVPAP